MLPNFVQLALVGFGGAVGAMIRLCVNDVSVHYWGDRFPWGTLIVNLVGCFALGLLLKLGENYVSENIRLAIGVGLLGGLTTFSSFGAEVWFRLQPDKWILALGTLSLNLFGGIAMVGLGVGAAWLIAGSKTAA